MNNNTLSNPLYCRQLLEKYQANTCNEEELALVMQLFEEEAYSGLVAEWLQTTWNTLPGNFQLRTAHSNALLLQIQQGIHPVQDIKQAGTPVRTLYKWMAAASVAAILIILSTLYFNNSGSKKDSPVQLSNSSGKPSAHTLPDGSHVWLNAESSISYSGNFINDRRIKLTGEAFFNVLPNKKAPFVVYAGGIQTTVLGTSFNVKAYSREKVTVSVATGKVSVTQENAPGKVPVMLTASQQTTFDTMNGLLPARTLAVNDIEAWTQNKLVFHNMPLSEVVVVLERWYGARITISNPLLQQCKVEGEYQQATLSEVLNTLQFALGFTYKQLPGGILIEGKGCKPAG